MSEFFSPRHIAVIGASAKNLWFMNLLENARRAGFNGAIYPVNPNADEVWGVRTCRTIEDLPRNTVDFAVIILKSTLVLDTVRSLAAKGIRNIVLISSGFAETGDEGARMQLLLRQYCRDHDILLMGPNCLGFMNPAAGVNVFTGGAVEGDLVSGTIGVVAQSGATSEMMVTKLLKESLGISLFVTTGNEAILSLEDYLEHLVSDGATRIITCFVEGVRNIPGLKRVAIKAARQKIPIILIKVGRSAVAVKAASSHTGALAGNDGVMDGFFRQYGIIRVDSIEELVETACIFSRLRMPGGSGLGICTLSGGLCGLYADLCAQCGISLPPLGEKTIHRLKEILPGFARPDNPLDVTGSGFQGGMEAITEILLDDEHIDILAPLCLSPKNEEDVFIHALNDPFMSRYHSSSKPLVPITFKEMNDYARRYFREKGIYFIEQPHLGFRALSHFMRYAEFSRRFGQQHQ